MHPSASRNDALLGRDAELGRIAGLAAAARAGEGAALVLTGEPGIGKTALLEQARAAMPGATVVQASGAEFEQEMPYTAVHQLCAPVLRHSEELPDHHRAALHTAFGMADGALHPLRVGMAILELLVSAAREQPVLCLVDDAQWLDAESLKALAFVARRVAADPVVILFALRAPGAPRELAELPRLALTGLSDRHARDLLAAHSPLPLDEQVRDRLVAEAHGNPLALFSLPRAGGFAQPAPILIEHVFDDRLAALPAPARLLLTVASADPTGDPGLLWPAARRLGVDVEAAAAEAAASGLAVFGTRVRFCHPLARSAAYRTADAGDRRAAHGALAEVTDPGVAPDRRAWHRAQATVSPDDGLADELQRCAARAQARGGMAAAAAFLERAAALTPSARSRAERTLDAAHAHLDAGGTDTAAALLTTVEVAPLDDAQHARADLLRGRIAFLRPADGSGPALMARAAQRLSTVDVAAARDCYLEALEMSLRVGRGGGVIHEIVAAARAEAPSPASPDVLDAIIALAAGGHATALPLLHDTLHRSLWTRWPALTTMISTELFDPENIAAIAEWLVKTGRESGSPVLLRLGLAQRATHATLLGDVGQALAVIAEEGAIADAAGLAPLVYPRLQLAAFRGRGAEVEELSAAPADAAGAGRVTSLHWAAAVLHNGLGDYPAALAAARRATEHGDVFLTGVALAELVEAAVRCREPEVAARALDALTERTDAGRTAYAHGVAAYARGLVTGAEEHFAAAVDRLGQGELAVYRGRAHLLYGEWLRRQGRRRDGVRQLREAHETLTAAGVEGFARRAADELRAAGERVGERSEAAHETLTLQEVAVARLVAGGATSNEVAVQLFISKRTVDAHLRNIFRKLGITSRRQLKDQPGIGK